MRKGQRTRAEILDTALGRAGEVGLYGLTIGDLASSLGLSKSGLFAHFQSKENLQLAVLETAVERFIDTVVRPAIAEPRGEPRVVAMFEHWLRWAHKQSPRGCIFASTTFELAGRKGALRNRLVKAQTDWIDALARAAEIAVEAGDFRADLDARQFAFEMESIMLGSLHGNLLIRDPESLERTRRAFDALLERSRSH